MSRYDAEEDTVDTDFTEREWSQAEIEDWIERFAEEMVPVDRFKRYYGVHDFDDNDRDGYS